MFQGRVTLLPGTEVRPVSFNKRQQNEEAFFQKHSWRAHVSQCFPVSNTGNIVSSVSFCFQDANYAYATRQGILTKIRACEHLQKFCEHEQASTHLIFTSNSSKGQVLRALPLRSREFIFIPLLRSTGQQKARCCRDDQELSGVENFTFGRFPVYRLHSPQE